MKKLTGPKKFIKIKTAIFISGRGSNLNNLIKFSLTQKSPIKITYVISSNAKAKGLDYAKKYMISYGIFEFSDKIKDEKKILNQLKKKKIELICLAGFMKILSKNFIKKFNNKILNIHPSLLPKYKGLNTHKRAIDNNEIVSGCTVHYVVSKLDSGRIILQKKIKIFKKDTPKTLEKRIRVQEHILYPKALMKVFSNF